MEARQPQFYRKVVPLSSEHHAGLHIDAAAGFEFAREATAVLLTTPEFSRAAREYPIVFLSDADTVNPVALLGLPGGNNQYITADGRWDASYIPAYVRRYPFIPGSGVAEKELVLCIDEDAPVISSEHGTALFSGGEQTDFLKQYINLIDDYQVQVQRTAQFSARLQELKLLVPMKAELKLDDVTNALTGFMVIDPARLRALRPAQVSELVKSDDMAAVYAHLSSMDNFKRLTPVRSSTAPHQDS